jgi:hypothetical protein
MFVWLTFAQTLTALIAGCEAAWEFFGGVFGVLSPDCSSSRAAALSPQASGTQTPRRREPYVGAGCRRDQDT